MIDWESAHRVATGHVTAIPLEATGDQAVLLDAQTVAYDFGWLFVYQSSWFVQTNDPRWMLLDNHAFLVSRADGAIVVIPRAQRDEILYRQAQLWTAGEPH